MKFWLSITLVLATCGLTAYIVVFESSWFAQTQPTKPSLEIAEVINKAKAYRKSEQYQKAIEVLKDALEKDPGKFDLTIELGKSYEQYGDIDFALSMYEKASTINPDHYLPYKLLGFLYLNQKKDRTEALKYLEKSIALNPNQPEVKMFLDSMKAKPPVAPKPPAAPVTHVPKPGPVIPTPKVPDPRPKIPTPPRPTGR